MIDGLVINVLKQCGMALAAIVFAFTQAKPVYAQSQDLYSISPLTLVFTYTDMTRYSADQNATNNGQTEEVSQTNNSTSTTPATGAVGGAFNQSTGVLNRLFGPGPLEGSQADDGTAQGESEYASARLVLAYQASYKGEGEFNNGSGKVRFTLREVQDFNIDKAFDEDVKNNLNRQANKLKTDLVQFEHVFSKEQLVLLRSGNKVIMDLTAKLASMTRASVNLLSLSGEASVSVTFTSPTITTIKTVKPDFSNEWEGPLIYDEPFGIEAVADKRYLVDWLEVKVTGPGGLSKYKLPRSGDVLYRMPSVVIPQRKGNE